METVGEAEAIAGEHRQGIPGWTHRGRWEGAGNCARSRHIGPIDPDASTLNQILKSFAIRATADALVDGGGGQVKILAHCGTSMHRPGHKRPIAGRATKNVTRDL